MTDRPTDARLEQDGFRLMPWARGLDMDADCAVDPARPSDRRHSARATEDDDPTETPGEQATLTGDR